MQLADRLERKPYVLLTHEEESGGDGARAFINDYPDAPENVMYMLGFDREGTDQFVMYGCGSERLEEHLYRHGFRKHNGSFSDISIIAPAWDVAAANLSCGYYDQHGDDEIINIAAINQFILPQAIKTLDCTSFDDILTYDDRDYSSSNNYGYYGYGGGYGYSSDDIVLCQVMNDGATPCNPECGYCYGYGDSLPLKYAGGVV